MLAIEGSARQTLDIRAGTTAFGIPGIIGSRDGFSPVPGTDGIGTSADIAIGSITNNEGVVFLTNQYQLNPSLSGSITIGSIDTSSDLGGGSIIIDSRSDIKITGNLNSSSTFGDAGNITLIANDAVSLVNNEIDASTFGRGKAGNVAIQAGGSVFLENGKIFSDVEKRAGGNGGNISITAESLSLTKKAELTANTFGEGNAGNIVLRINGPVTIVNGSLILSEVGVKEEGKVRGSGKGGLIDIEAGSLLLIDDGRITVRTRADGDAGRIIIKVTDAVGLVNGGRITSGVNSEAVGKGGNIEILRARSFSAINGGFLQASTSGNGNAGNIIVNASEFIELSGIDRRKGNNQGRSSGLFASTEEAQPGQGGTIEVRTGRLRVLNGAVISVISNSNINCPPCQGGKIVVNANTLEVIAGGQLLSAALSQGDAGDIIINAADQILISGSDPTFADRSVKFPRRTSNIDAASGLFAQTKGAGKAGDITVTTPNLTIGKDAEISATATSTSTNTEGGGSITINAAYLDLTGKLGIFAETQGKSPAGTLNIQPDNNKPNLDIQFTDTAIISASTTGSGAGGDINLSAPETINVTGKGKVAVETTGTGNAGSINITTQQLNLSNQTEVSASTLSSGQAGNINVSAKRFKLTSGAKVTTNTTSSGRAGDIQLNISDNLNLINSTIEASTAANSTGDGGNVTIDTQEVTLTNSQIAVNSQGEGSGGNITLQADTLNLANQSAISAETLSSDGGNISLQVKDLLLLRTGSQISATAGTAGAGGDGGNIDIDAKFIVAVPRENSDITANAFLGDGGNINITTQGLLGIKERERPTPLSDITASSEFGLAGVVQINQVDVDPNRSLVELPETFAAPPLAQGCRAGKAASTGSFVYVGRGGLPPNPREPLSPQAVWHDLRPPGRQRSRQVGAQGLRPEQRSRKESSEKQPVVVLRKRVGKIKEIRQAQGWIVTPDGTVILTAEPPTVTPQNPGLNHPGCQISSES